MKTITPPSLDVVDGVYYPSSDGKPMAETDLHVLALFALFETVKKFLQVRLGFYVAANIFWYWEKGNPRARCSPDVMVIRGVEDRFRRSFRSWQENDAVPSVIFEISSEETWRTDLIRKRALYARQGVQEYFLFDPEALYLDPPLRGFRLRDGELEELEPAADGSLTSEELRLRLIREGWMLRLLDLETGEPILTEREQAAFERRQKEHERKEKKKEQRAKERERKRADQAEAEVERLKQMLAALDQNKNGGSAAK